MFTVTLKLSTEPADPWLIIRAETQEELTQKLQDLGIVEERSNG